MTTKRVLIVDDNDDFRKVLGDYLVKHKLGLKIFEAGSGEIGIAQTISIRPDIVLMDINLPGASGFETTRIIKECHPDCAVIILTMFETRVFREAARGVNAAEFIGKSEIEKRLIPVIKKCLAIRRKPS